MNPYPIHVGSLIRVELIRQDQSVTWLAEQLGIERTNCYRFLRAQSKILNATHKLTLPCQSCGFWLSSNLHHPKGSLDNQKVLSMYLV